MQKKKGDIERVKVEAAPAVYMVVPMLEIRTFRSLERVRIKLKTVEMLI